LWDSVTIDYLIRDNRKPLGPQNGLMRRHILLTLFTAGLLCIHAADRAREVQLQKALDLMQTKGDIAGAIKLLEEVGKSPDRNLAARSLLHLGECRLQLGQQEASKSFERVVREYSDQQDVAAAAQTKLASLRPKPVLQSGIANRKVLTVPDGGWIEGKISPDGRYVPYVNYKDGGNLYLHDQVSGTERQLTNTGNDAKERAPGEEYQCAHEHAFSRDGKRLVYAWNLGGTGGTRYELRVINLQGSGTPSFRKLFAHDDVEWVMPHDWSPDGKWIAVQLQRKDKIAQIGLVGADDGSLRVLKSVDWRGPNLMAFSPDGRYLAYDLAAGETTLQRDIYVLAVDGSREVPGVVHPADDTLLGWSPDGSRLLFASDRSGGTDLWARPYSEDQPQGRPEMLKRDIGRFDIMGVTSSGKLHYSLSSFRPSDVVTAEFDFEKGEYISRPVQAVSTYVGSNQSPDWSRDGKYLAWMSRRKSHGGPHFVIGYRSLENGQVRELLLPPNFYALSGVALSWSHDGKSLLLAGQNKGVDGIYRVDRDSGHISLVVPVQRPAFALESLDGQTLYYSHGNLDSGGVRFVKHVLGSGEERVLLKGNHPGFTSLSPDGRYLVVQENLRPRIPLAILLVPTDGTEPRDLIRVENPHRVAFLAWTPDRQAAIITKFIEGVNGETLWRVPFNGGAPTQLETKVRLPGNFKLHPDGRQMAFQVPTPAKPPEVWVLENFLPGPPANK